MYICIYAYMYIVYYMCICVYVVGKSGYPASPVGRSDLSGVPRWTPGVTRCLPLDTRPYPGPLDTRSYPGCPPLHTRFPV